MQTSPRTAQDLAGFATMMAATDPEMRDIVRRAYKVTPLPDALQVRLVFGSARQIDALRGWEGKIAERIEEEMDKAGLGDGVEKTYVVECSGTVTATVEVKAESREEAEVIADEESLGRTAVDCDMEFDHYEVVQVIKG